MRYRRPHLASLPLFLTVGLSTVACSKALSPEGEHELSSPRDKSQSTYDGGKAPSPSDASTRASYLARNMNTLRRSDEARTLDSAELPVPRDTGDKLPGHIFDMSGHVQASDGCDRSTCEETLKLLERLNPSQRGETVTCCISSDECGLRFLVDGSEQGCFTPVGTLPNRGPAATEASKLTL